MASENSSRFMTRSELAAALGISRWTLARRLKEKGIKLPKGLLEPQVIEEIFLAFGIKPPEE